MSCLGFRENWALPFLSVRTLCTVQLLQRSHRQRSVEVHTRAQNECDDHGIQLQKQMHDDEKTTTCRLLLLASLWTSTLLFATSWQFAPFVLALQAFAVLLVSYRVPR